MESKLKKIFLISIVLTLLLTAIPSYAQNNASTEGATTISLQMQPLAAKYNLLTKADLDTELAKFTDSTTHWGKEYISKISALGIISGYGNGRFGPNDKLLGGQFVLMLIRTMGFTPEVPSGTPYYKPFVEIALKEGIIQNGEIADYMKPISRELAASLARRAVGKYEAVPTDYFVPGDDPEALGNKGFFDNVYVGYQRTKMNDYPTITSKYLQDVIDCYRIGLITGSNNKFNPKGCLTRAEAAVIITKLIDKSMRVESVPGADEQFKIVNQLTSSPVNRSEEAGKRENKEYTIYKGLFPLIEIWETSQAMDKHKNKLVGGAYDMTYNEKTQFFTNVWFISPEIEYDSRMNNQYATILPTNLVYVYPEKLKLKKTDQFNAFNNEWGYMYEVSSWDVDNYNKAMKSYIYELMKVWFGDEYKRAKELHDQYLSYALNSTAGKYDFYMINGRQVHFIGGHDMGGNSFAMQVWAKGTVTKETMYRYNH